MKYLYTLALCLLSFALTAQTIKVSDAISKEPVPFATIIATDNGEPVSRDYSSQDGTVKISTRGYDTLQFSCLGYNDKLIRKEDIGGEVYMEPNAFILDEVVISGLTDVVTVGYTNMKKLNFSGTAEGFQDAVYIPNNLGKETYIKSFLFKIVESKSRFAYRLHFYKPSKDKRHPAREITRANIVRFIEKGTKGLADIDVSEYKVAFPTDGVYVSVEGLGSCDANGKIIETKYSYITYEDFQSAEPIFCHQPEFFIRTGWINENERTLRDFKENYKTEAPKELLRVPQFGLKVYR